MPVTRADRVRVVEEKVSKRQVDSNEQDWESLAVGSGNEVRMSKGTETTYRGPTDVQVFWRRPLANYGQFAHSSIDVQNALGDNLGPVSEQV